MIRPINSFNKMRSIVSILCLLLAVSGCHLDDPNHNGKAQYARARHHASRFLKDEVGVQEQFPLQSYELMIFGRQWYDKNRREFHNLKLYDYLKKDTSSKGPHRFVIAYDYFDRQTYLRDDLRSNENIESWEEFQRRSSGNTSVGSEKAN